MDNSISIPSNSIAITVEFTGGLEMLFSHQRLHQVSLPVKDESGRTATLGFLVRYLCQHLMKDQRRELFVLNDEVRPGILVLINDVDWGLEGEENYEPQHRDSILFVSTLHGG